jgi:hypothetical protein
MTAHPDRAETIRRAIKLIDETLGKDMAAYLAQAALRPPDPDILRARLASADVTDSTGAFGAWKAAQRLLEAAGLPR